MHDSNSLSVIQASELFDIVSFWAVNFTSAFLLSAAHNVLIFVLDWRTSILHFLHYGCTFGFLFLKSSTTRLINRIQTGNVGDATSLSKSVTSPSCDRRELSVRDALSVIYPAVITQVVVSILSAEVHSQNRAGELYLLRIFDFLSTITALKVKSMLSDEVRPEKQPDNHIWNLLLPVALAGSLSWVEFGHIEFDRWSLLLAPVLAVVQGFHFVVVKRICIRFEDLCACGRRSGSIFESFALFYTGFVSAALTLPALISFSLSVISYDASWESIDYVLIGMSIVFMASFKYSELWLQTHLKLHHFCALEHTKYFMGSCGQWFLQNMAHASVYAACGKALFLASILRYWSGFEVLSPLGKQNDA